jgi:hypothetical protein
MSVTFKGELEFEILLYALGDLKEYVHKRLDGALIDGIPDENIHGFENYIDTICKMQERIHNVIM